MRVAVLVLVVVLDLGRSETLPFQIGLVLLQELVLAGVLDLVLVLGVERRHVEDLGIVLHQVLDVFQGLAVLCIEDVLLCVESAMLSTYLNS